MVRVDYKHDVSSSVQMSKNAYRSSFSAVQIAVGDDLGKCDNPVVDLVSSSPLHW